MAAHGHAAGGFAADDGVRFSHFGRDPLEPDRDLIARLAKPLRHAVEQVRGGVIAHARPLPAAVAHEIIVQQDEQLVGMDKVPLFIDDAETVGVAVGRNAEAAVPVDDHLRQRAERIDVRRGQLAAEKRVVAVMDDLQLAPAGHEEHLQPRLADAVHGVERNAKPRALDGVHVDGGKDAVQIFIHGVALGDLPGGKRFVIVDALDVRRCQEADLPLDIARHLCVRVAAAGGEDLDAVIDRRVVAGRDGDAVRHMVRLDREHDERRRRGAVDDERPEAVARQDLRRPMGRLLG